MPKATIRYKPEVSDPKLADPKIREAIETAAEVWGEWVKELWVTSLNDGKHRVGSFHYQNKAVDLRTKNLPSTEAKRLAVKKLAGRLGSDYKVILEFLGGVNEHCHCQYEGD